jgi:hypothetical protein
MAVGNYAGRMRIREMALAAAFLVAVVLDLMGCFGKPLARTAADIARVLCEEAVTGNAEILQGKTAQELCALDHVLAPFIDEVLAAKKRGLQRLSAPAPVTEAPAAEELR